MCEGGDMNGNFSLTCQINLACIVKNKQVLILAWKPLFHCNTWTWVEDMSE